MLQVEVAALMGVNEWTYINWEKGLHEPVARFYPAVITFLRYEPWELPASLAEALLAERRRRGLSVERAAELTSIDPGTWLRWEHGEWKVTSRTEPALNGFLGFSVRERFPQDVR
jgi:DNA-binding XRE family transcriptional regulator